jgi:hypothetical protein
MAVGASTGPLLAGGILILLGILILWRTSRYDLKGALMDSVWQIARRKRSADNPTAIEAKLREIQAEATLTGKARRVAKQVIGHYLAQALGIVALVVIGFGAILVAVGLFWT